MEKQAGVGANQGEHQSFRCGAIEFNLNLCSSARIRLRFRDRKATAAYREGSILRGTVHQGMHPAQRRWVSEDGRRWCKRRGKTNGDLVKLIVRMFAHKRTEEPGTQWPRVDRASVLNRTSSRTLFIAPNR